MTLVGRDGRTATFPNRLLLAPMEGITEACFRDLVIDLGGVGGACTEFIRISSSPVPVRVVRRHLGAPRQDVPVGVQLMAADEEHLAASVAAAERAGAAWIDLNFGCPAPVVFDKCAGSALLAKPERIAAIVAAAVGATALPVSAKMRAGIAAAAQLEELVAAAAGAGAAMLTVHARLRTQSYAQAATWEWIARAKAVLLRCAPDVPLVGNGGVERAEDAERLRRETGCDAVMIGRAALADPWIFARICGHEPASAAQAAGFAVAYGDALRATYGERTALARIKQLAKHYRAGDLLGDDQRQRMLRLGTYGELRAVFSLGHATESGSRNRAGSPPARSAAAR